MRKSQKWWNCFLAIILPHVVQFTSDKEQNIPWWYSYRPARYRSNQGQERENSESMFGRNSAKNYPISFTQRPIRPSTVCLLPCCFSGFWKVRGRPAPVALLVASQYALAWLWWPMTLGSRPRLTGHLYRVIAAYALRLNSRAGTEGSMLSSLNCDCWLVLHLEALSH